MTWKFKDVLALVTILGTFAIVWGIGAGWLNYGSDLVRGIIVGGILQWDAWIFMTYFKKNNGGQK